MIDIRPADSRFTADHGWLKSNFSFSFAEYYDPDNLQFGPLRVFNDDTVQPNRGFGSHPHKEMEIVSVVLKGLLQHKDSTGEEVTTTFGEVQRMSAGTGVVHSEMNPSDKEEVNFLQLWFLPEKQGLGPSYEHTKFDIKKMKNRLLPIVSKYHSSDEVAYIHQDMTIFLGELEPEKSLDFLQEEGRRIYIFNIDGSLRLNDEHTLEKRDTARITNQITNQTKLQISSQSGSTFMLIDLP